MIPQCNVIMYYFILFLRPKAFAFPRKLVETTNEDVRSLTTAGMDQPSQQHWRPDLISLNDACPVSTRYIRSKAMVYFDGINS